MSFSMNPDPEHYLLPMRQVTSDRNVLILLGSTGVGKTCFIHSMAGAHNHGLVFRLGPPPPPLYQHSLVGIIVPLSLLRTVSISGEHRFRVDGLSKPGLGSSDLG